MKFGEMLVREGIVTADQLRTALDRQVVFGGRIGTNLVELGILREGDLTALLSRFLRAPAMDADINSIPDEVIQCFTPHIAERYKVIPFRKARKRLHVGIADVQDASAIDELRFKSGFDIVPYVVSEIRLLYGLEKYYGIKRDLRYISIFSGKKTDPQRSDRSRSLS
ncbi:MAG: GspE/PulE/PilB domain-containing protein [Thermodesulfovibrionales bacterium]